MPRIIKTDTTPNGRLAPDVEEPIITSANREPIKRVLADPGQAWRSESIERRRASVRLRGFTNMTEASDDDVDDTLERAIGNDDIVPSAWLRQGLRTANAVARITQPLPATGFLVSDWLLLTNHHVLDTAEIAAGAVARFRYEEDDNGAINPVTVRFDPDRCFLTGTDDKDGLDFTLVALQPLADGTAPGATFGRVPLIGTIGKVLIGEPLNIVQHPQGLPRQIAFRNNALLSLDDPIHLIYQTDTDHGSSGSPVLNDRWQLVALHQRAESARNADGEEMDSLGRRVTRQTPNHLREWVANAGIRVSCIVEHLKNLPLDPPLRELVNAAFHPAASFP